MSEVIFRIKVVWAGICVLVGGLAIALFSFAQMPSEIFHRIAIGTALATFAAGGTPLIDATLRTKITLMWIGIAAGLSYAQGPGKWPEGAIIAVVIAAIFWISCAAILWVIQGFKRKDTSD